MARKLAILYWRVMVKGLDYAEQGIKNYEEQLLMNKMKTLTRLTKNLNVKCLLICRLYKSVIGSGRISIFVFAYVSGLRVSGVGQQPQ